VAFENKDIERAVEYSRTERVQQIILDRQGGFDEEGRPLPPLRIIVNVEIRENGHTRTERREVPPATVAAGYPPPTAVRSWLNAIIDNAERV
jgi:hypothetical protein